MYAPYGYVFPARAGMSPSFICGSRSMTRVPRASGDEPDKKPTEGAPPKCSPRERG